MRTGPDGSDVRPPSDGVPRLRPRDPVGRAVILSLETALSRIREAEAGARGGEVEGVHRFRTTTRRLRSELRAFRGLVDPAWIGPLEEDLTWLAGLLGAVRDVDVLTARFRKTTADVGPPEALAPLFDELTSRHDRALQELCDALRGDRYRELLGAIRHAIDRPSPGDPGDIPCREALPPRAAAAWRRLKKSARALRPGDPDEDFHEVRKRAKRARYTAEMVAPIISGAAAKGGRRFIRDATRVQDILGEHQDAVVAGHEVALLLERHASDDDFERAARRLLEGQARAARDAREEFFDAWDKLDRKKSRRWLSASKAGG